MSASGCQNSSDIQTTQRRQRQRRNTPLALLPAIPTIAIDWHDTRTQIQVTMLVGTASQRSVMRRGTRAEAECSSGMAFFNSFHREMDKPTLG